MKKENIMNKKTVLQKILALVCALVLCATMPENVFAAKIKAAILEKGKIFTLTDMPYNGAYCPQELVSYKGESLVKRSVQNFAFTPDGKYVFTVAEGYTGAESAGNKHTVLCRCAMPQKLGVDEKAAYVQGSVLGNYGHGEAIAITQPNEKKETYYIWVSCTPNDDKAHRYGTEIARLTYKVNNKGVGKITAKTYIGNLGKSNVSYSNGKTSVTDQLGSDAKKGIVDRVNVAVDTESNKIAFRVHYKVGGCNYIVYNYKKLNKAINQAGNGKTLDLGKYANLQVANLRVGVIPYNTFQSFDIVGDNLFVSGGHMDLGASIYRMQYKVYGEGKTSMQRFDDVSAVAETIEIEPKLTVADQTLNKASLEIEGMKVERAGKGKYNYCVNFYQKDITIRDQIGVYMFEN